jgi:hypothetical protein
MIEHVGGGKYRHVHPVTGDWVVSHKVDDKTILCDDQRYPFAQFERDGADPRGTSQKQADHFHGRPFDPQKGGAAGE